MGAQRVQTTLESSLELSQTEGLPSLPRQRPNTCYHTAPRTAKMLHGLVHSAAWPARIAPATAKIAFQKCISFQIGSLIDFCYQFLILLESIVDHLLIKCTSKTHVENRFDFKLIFLTFTASENSDFEWNGHRKLIFRQVCKSFSNTKEQERIDQNAGTPWGDGVAERVR